MGKSPKGAGAENGSGNKESKPENGFNTFKFGNKSSQLDPEAINSSNKFNLPFDDLVESDSNEHELVLTETTVPPKTLALPRSNTVGNSESRNSPQKVQKPLVGVGTRAISTKKQGQASGTPKQQSDPEKLSDALLSAGVDLKEEEALLSSTVVKMKSNSQVLNSQIPLHPPFLHPSHVANMMKRIAIAQNFNQDFSQNTDLLSLMSTACELYMRDIVTNSIIISRHRRKALKLNSGRRSEIARVLRDLALKQREQEERRLKRRVALGLEKETMDTKLDSGETLYRASNATANMMIAGGKKKYSWLTSGAKSNPNDFKNAGKVSSVVAARGDFGIKYREAREEPGIVMRDLLRALENRRVGVSNTIAKGYARIRD